MWLPSSESVSSYWAGGCAWLPQRSGTGDTDAVLDDHERAELERLRRENAELRLDREFLKKAAAFFASEQNR